MKKRLRTMLLAGVAAGLFAALGAAGCGSSSEKKKAGPTYVSDGGGGGEPGANVSAAGGQAAGGDGAGTGVTAGTGGAVATGGAGGVDESGGARGAITLTGCGLGDACCAANQCEAQLNCLGTVCSCVADLSNHYMIRGDGTAFVTLAGTNRAQSAVINADTALPLHGVVSIMGSLYHGCAALDTGEVRCWPLAGDSTANSSGQLGNGVVDPAPPAGKYAVLSATLVKVDATTKLTNVVSVGGGSATYGAAATTCAVTKTGNLYCWGDGTPQIINAATASAPTPFATQINTDAAKTPLTGVTQVGIGERHACVLLDTGKVRCWGSIGGGPTALQAYPKIDFTVPGTVTKLAVGYRFSCALNSAGAVYCWGTGGALGLGPAAASSDSAQRVLTSGVAFLDGVTDLSIAYGGACVLRNDHSIWCWGASSYATPYKEGGVPVTDAVRLSTAGDPTNPRWVTSSGAEWWEHTMFVPNCSPQEG